jgi:predicted permease
LSELLTLFGNNILPIFLAASAGYLSARYLQVEPQPVSKIAFYIFSPCLIFTLLTTSTLNGDDITRMVGFTIASVLALGLITWVFGRLFKLERRLMAAVLLTVMFGNAGNYGLSLNLFAFGENALAYASLYFVIVAIMVYTIGVFIASLGSMNIKNALQGLLKVPAIYAVLLAMLFKGFDLSLAVPINRAVTVLSDAAIPVLMVLLGIQLYQIHWDGETLAISISNVMRLVAAPLLAIGFGLAFGLDGAAYQAGVLESAMPTAVVMTVLATEYDVRPTFVTTVVFTSTLLSPITVTPLLAILGA